MAEKEKAQKVFDQVKTVKEVFNEKIDHLSAYVGKELFMNLSDDALEDPDKVDAFRNLVVLLEEVEEIFKLAE